MPDHFLSGNPVADAYLSPGKQARYTVCLPYSGQFHAPEPITLPLATTAYGIYLSAYLSTY